jgi:hypothetical protein
LNEGSLEFDYYKRYFCVEQLNYIIYQRKKKRKLIILVTR